MGDEEGAVLTYRLSLDTRFSTVLRSFLRVLGGGTRVEAGYLEFNHPRFQLYEIFVKHATCTCDQPKVNKL